MSAAEPHLLDLSFLYNLAEDDTNYIYEVITLYLNSTPVGLTKLETLVKGTNDYEAIHRQAHSLKSGAGIIKVREMYDDLATIEDAAIKKQDMNKMIPVIDNILKNFRAALPLIEAEQERNRP